MSPTRTRAAGYRTSTSRPHTTAARTWTRTDPGQRQRRVTEALQPSLDVAPNGIASVSFYDRRLPCRPQERQRPSRRASRTTPGRAPHRARRTVARTTASTRRSSSTAELRKPDPAIGHNIRLSAHTWDPQLNAPHQGCICMLGDVHRRLLRRHLLRARQDVHHVGVDVRLRGREPDLLPAADRRGGDDAGSVTTIPRRGRTSARPAPPGIAPWSR